MALVRSISGLRGTHHTLTPELIRRYIIAYTSITQGGPIVIGRDGRPSGTWIEETIIETLLEHGISVRNIGLAPTPTIQLSTERSDARGGISITASHNPSEWNGLKFLTADGVFLGSKDCETLFRIADSKPTGYHSDIKQGILIQSGNAIDEHISAVLALPFINLPALQARKYRVVVDAVNASGSYIVPALLEQCGCEVIRLYCDGSGSFPHTPEPVPENLHELAQAVPAHNADIGIAVDPDADRLVLIDERGEPFGEEYTITHAADFILQWERERDSNKKLTVVVNLSTTRAVEDVALRYNANVSRSPVGEINVVEQMKATHAILGGEGSGGVILPEVHYGRDSLVGIAITLQHLLSSGGSLSALKSSLPKYEIAKKKVTIPDTWSPSSILEQIASQAPVSVSVNSDDGLRLSFDDSWVHLRGSNTEPIIRVIAEAPTFEEAEQLANHYLQIVRAVVS